MDKKKIGLLGGAFDPPHSGHLILAAEAKAAANLDEVWFLPSYIPPHMERKSSKTVTPAEIRIDMVERAIKEEPNFQVSRAEYERAGKSYTYDTLKYLQNKYPHDTFYFIIGGDMVNDLPKWYKYEELITFVKFLATHRAGVETHHPSGVDIQYFEMPLIEISSTMIRERYKEGKPWHYFLPASVKNYIEEKDLYE